MGSQKKNFLDKHDVIFNDICTVFSHSRMIAYLERGECRDKLDALAAYYWNVQLSQSLYPLLQALEVALRNALHRCLSESYQTEYWFDGGFLYNKEQEAVIQAKMTLKKQNKSIDANRVVAELRFGFWTSLFDVRYEYQQILWPRLLPKIFPYIPKSFRTRHYPSK